MSAVGPSSPPKLKPISEEERAKNAWWFRQIATTLALGNAGGVVAISGFAGNIENVALGMVVSYPAIPFFFAGAFLAFVSFIVQFGYSFTRMEALAEHDRELNEWRLANNIPRSVNLISTAMFFLYMAVMIGCLGMSGYYFYKGAASVSYATAAISCVGSQSSSGCRADGAWLFVTPSADMRARVAAALRAKAAVDEDKQEACRVVVTSELHRPSIGRDPGGAACVVIVNAGDIRPHQPSAVFDK